MPSGILAISSIPFPFKLKLCIRCCNIEGIYRNLFALSTISFNHGEVVSYSSMISSEKMLDLSLHFYWKTNCGASLIKSRNFLSDGINEQSLRSTRCGRRRECHAPQGVSWPCGDLVFGEGWLSVPFRI